MTPYHRPDHWPDCDRATCTLNHGLTEAQMVSRRGWKVGDVVEGDEGYGVERLRITGVGERMLIGRRDDHKSDCEGPWTLSCRCWRKVTP
jgi:hypothetical protein